MKSLVKKLANTNIGILLRNSLNFKPVSLKVFKKEYYAPQDRIIIRFNTI